MQPISDVVYRTTSEWELKLGQQVRKHRLLRNLSQIEVAERAGVALSALKNLEGGKGATLKTFIKVLKTLDRVRWLESLAPTISISPMQILKMKKLRQRASSPRKEN